MDKQQRIEEVGKYIEKHYVPGNDDIELDDEEVKGFFSKISEFLSNRKAQPSEKTSGRMEPSDSGKPVKKAAPEQEEDADEEAIVQDSASTSTAQPLEDARPEFDLSTAKRKKVSKPMTEAIVGNRNLDDLMSQMDETFSQRLLRMIKERGMTESEAYKKAFVDRRHFSKIKNDEYYSPNKKTVLAFAVALELTLDETKDLLRSAGYALSRSSKFDIIIVYFLENKVYDIFEINEVLYEYGQPTFG